MGSLEYAIPSVGGFCVGTSYVVDHQRLSGLGYCFSASLPPMLAAAAITAIDSMEQQPDMFLELNNVCRILHEALSSMHHLKLGGHQDAPVKHLRLAKSTGCHKHDGQLLRQIANEVTPTSLYNLWNSTFMPLFFFVRLGDEEGLGCNCGFVFRSVREVFASTQPSTGGEPSSHRR